MTTDKEKAAAKKAKLDAVAWGRSWANAAQARVKAAAARKSAIK